MTTRVLVVGGQRSGKSRYAETLVAESGLAPVYLAIATAGDAEMAERIDTHRSRRGVTWRTIEEPLDIAAVLARESRPGTVVLVECLTLWLSNLMGAGRNIDIATEGLIAALEQAAGPVVLVSNEVGAGIMPDNALARRYADALGVLNQRIAAVATRVVLVAAGQPLTLKPSPQQEISRDEIDHRRSPLPAGSGLGHRHTRAPPPRRARCRPLAAATGCSGRTIADPEGKSKARRRRSPGSACSMSRRCSQATRRQCRCRPA